MQSSKQKGRNKMRERGHGKILSLYLVMSLLMTVSGCAFFAYTNEELDSSYMKTPLKDTKATFCVSEDRGKFKDVKDKRTLVILSLSGGGSRAAYWSASVMLALQEVFKAPEDSSDQEKKDAINLLEEVDIISSVSGGSLPAAYYAISKDYDDPDIVKSNRHWGPDTVKKLMSKNYRSKWLWNWFWPHNIVRYWFTAYDRSDIMAKTFSDNMFDKQIFGEKIAFDNMFNTKIFRNKLTFDDINRKRPYLIINSTNGTEECFSDVFTFTHDDFLKINSDINDYDISRAVMASASFPSAFNYMTLRDFNECSRKKYVHVFDAGNADNLGLTSVERIIDRNKDTYNKIIVILIDATTKSPGVDKKDYDARSFLDYYVDLNFLDSVDTLMTLNRESRLESLRSKLRELSGEKEGNYNEYKGDGEDNPKCTYGSDEEGIAFCKYKNKERESANTNIYETIFYHITFEDIDKDNSEDMNLQDQLNAIGTDFRISDESVCAIDEAVKHLVVKENECLQKIVSLLDKDNDQVEINFDDCKWDVPVDPVKRKDCTPM